MEGREREKESKLSVGWGMPVRSEFVCCALHHRLCCSTHACANQRTCVRSLEHDLQMSPDRERQLAAVAATMAMSMSFNGTANIKPRTLYCGVNPDAMTEVRSQLELLAVVGLR